MPRSSRPFTLSRAAARAFDRHAVARLAIPSILLMENASAAVARAALDLLSACPRGPVFIFCGKGHNGGDGLCAARHLHNAGIPVALILAAPLTSYTDDSAVNAAITRKLRLPCFLASPARPHAAFAAFAAAQKRLGAPGLIIDALLGTGLDRPVAADSLLAKLIAQINAARRPPDDPNPCHVLAIDLPSGLDCDTGRPLVAQPRGAPPTAVIADLTVTMVAWKQGFLKPSARPFIGSVTVADIGAPLTKARPSPPRPRSTQNRRPRRN